MLVLDSCKFDEAEFIVTEKRKDGETVFPIQSQLEHSRANNSVMKSPTRSKFELTRDLMPVLVICKFDKDPTKGD